MGRSTGYCFGWTVCPFPTSFVHVFFCSLRIFYQLNLFVFHWCTNETSLMGQFNLPLDFYFAILFHCYCLMVFLGKHWWLLDLCVHCIAVISLTLFQLQLSGNLIQSSLIWYLGFSPVIYTEEWMLLDIILGHIDLQYLITFHIIMLHLCSYKLQAVSTSLWDFVQV